MKQFEPFLKTLKRMGVSTKDPIIIKDTLTSRLNDFFKRSGVDENTGKSATAHFKASAAVGLQLLNWTINGSSNESTVPPIQLGVLRGSGSVFVNNVLLGDTKSNYPDGTPNMEYTESGGGITIGFNTAYAARLHETTWVPGGRIPSKQASNNAGLTGDVGNKFVEKHLKADGKALLGLYADIYKKEMGT